jgi:hypothetical protein
MATRRVNPSGFEQFPPLPSTPLIESQTEAAIKAK